MVGFYSLQWLSSIPEQVYHSFFSLSSFSTHVCCFHVSFIVPFLYCCLECRLVQPLWKSEWRMEKQLKIDLSCNLAIPLLGINSKEMKSTYEKVACNLIFTETSTKKIDIRTFKNRQKKILTIQTNCLKDVTCVNNCKIQIKKGVHENLAIKLTYVETFQSYALAKNVSKFTGLI